MRLVIWSRIEIYKSLCEINWISPESYLNAIPHQCQPYNVLVESQLLERLWQYWMGAAKSFFGQSEIRSTTCFGHQNAALDKRRRDLSLLSLLSCSDPPTRVVGTSCAVHVLAEEVIECGQYKWTFCGPMIVSLKALTRIYIYYEPILLSAVVASSSGGQWPGWAWRAWFDGNALAKHLITSCCVRV